MNFINFEISVILALIGFILTLLGSIFVYRLNKKHEAEKETKKRKEEQRNLFLGPGGIPPKSVDEAVWLAQHEGRDVKLPSNIVRLIIAFFVIGTASYIFGNIRGLSPVNGTETPVYTPNNTTPFPVIVSGGPCEVAVGKTMPLAASGVSGAGVVYRWTATAGNVNPPEGPAVNYIAPDTPGDVIIRVEAEKDGVISDATINCKVIGPTPTPVNTATLAPTLTPVPSPTSWACSSFRSAKVQDADVPGVVTIDTPLQGTSDIPSGRNVQVTGTHAGIPAGKYLWVFIYSPWAGQHGRYYPQTKDAINGWQPEPTTGQDGHWALDVNFGAANACYEVIVMVTDAAASQSIANQLKSWANVNNYAGYELNGPPSADPPDAPGFPDGLVEKASVEVKTK